MRDAKTRKPQSALTPWGLMTNRNEGNEMTENNYTVSLRPYQANAINEIRRRLQAGQKRVMAYSPTGSGKTELAIGIAQFARSKGKRMMFLANRIDLVGQAVERFGRYGIQVGVIQGQNTFHPHAPLTVASIQTLASRQKFGWHFDVDLILIDEAHACAGSDQYRQLIRKWNNVPIIGLSATPFSRGLGKEYEWGRLFDSLVVVSTIRELIDQGYLVDCEIYAPSEPDLTGVKIVAGDYHEAQLGEAVDKPTLIGDIVSHWRRLANGQQTIVFATNIAHSKHIVEQFQSVGVLAEHCDCYLPEDERNAIIQRFKAGEITVLSNCSLFAEGFDAPATGCMVLARPTKSLIRFIQMCGRVLRPHDGKDKALILDHSGTVRRLGFPTDDLPLELDDGKPRRNGDGKPKEKLPSVCPSCGYVDQVRRPACPSCGFKPERKSDIQHESGELKKITRKTDDKQSIYSALVGHYKEMVRAGKRWREGWVANQYRDITGVWPRGMNWTAGPMTQEVANHLMHNKIKWLKDREKKEKGNQPSGCPRCDSTDFVRGPGKGPHAASARCSKCNMFWWLKK